MTMSGSAGMSPEALARLVEQEPAWWSGAMDPALLGTMLAMIGAGALALALVSRVHRDRALHGPESRAWCRMMGVGRRERAVLQRVAHAAGFPDAVTLLASRGAMAHALQASRSVLSTRLLRRAERIAQRFFAEPSGSS